MGVGMCGSSGFFVNTSAQVLFKEGGSLIMNGSKIEKKKSDIFTDYLMDGNFYTCLVKNQLRGCCYPVFYKEFKEGGDYCVEISIELKEGEFSRDKFYGFSSFDDAYRVCFENFFEILLRELVSRGFKG